MSFPVDPLSTKVELYLGVTLGWVDVTAWTYTRDSIVIRRGRSDESSGFAPGECRLTLNNRDGRFSPRNPSGPYYGALTRNTPIRVSVKLSTVALESPTSLTDYMSTPDSAALSITGDLDVRVDAANAWTGGRFASKGLGSPQRSWIFDSFVGNAILYWSADGTTLLSATSTVPLPTTGRYTVRATLDVDNGAAGRTVTFYTGTSVNGPWTVLGAPVVQAGVTSIFDSTSEVRTPTIGGARTFALKVLQGIGGTERANPDFSAQSPGTTSFADAAGNTWTIVGAAAIAAEPGYRFHGEVSSWPQQWDLSEKDAWVPIQTAGILRRLGQGSDALKSSIQRFVVRSALPVSAYWPMEEGDGATSIGSGLAGGTPMTITGGPPRFAVEDGFISSNPLPELALSTFSAPAGGTNTGTIYAHFFLHVPEGGEGAGAAVLFRLFTTGTAARWDLFYNPTSTGQWTMRAYDALGTQLFSSDALIALEGARVSVNISLVQNGSNIDWSVNTNGYVDPTPGLGIFSGTLNSRTVGAATFVQINPDATLDQTSIGHLVVYAAVPNTTVQLQALRGYPGETAGRRIERLCGEENIAFTPVGDLDDTAAVGAQRPLPFLDLLAECEAADLGQLYEPREQFGLAYRTRESRAAQSVTLALAYTNLSQLEPVEDDQATRNDVTVSRVNGSSARASVDTGPLSTQAPPSGVGRYTDNVELNLATDSQLADQANLRVAIGTIDEPRYPVISIRLADAPFAASNVLTTAALDVDHGDRITVTGTPIWVPPGLIDQHTIGQTETLSPFGYQIDYVCQPAKPIGTAGIYDATAMRWAADSSTLNATMTTGATSVTVATASGPLWTTTDVPFDITVAGEQMTIGAVSGASSPQTFSSITRSVNGVVKTHAIGESVQIAAPVYYAL